MKICFDSFGKAKVFHCLVSVNFQILPFSQENTWML